MLLHAATGLGPARWRCSVVASLGAALRLMREEPPDCVLLDLDLPDSTADSLVGAVRDCLPAVPLIGLSAAGDPQQAILAIRHGADDCLEKGRFDARELSRAVDLARARGTARGGLLCLALRDPLTGLANRAQFEDALVRAVARANRSRQELALLTIELDGFKAIGDALGHEAGAALLRAAARRFARELRVGDTLARAVAPGSRRSSRTCRRARRREPRPASC